MNKNKFAKLVTEDEGKKKSLSIAQVKEVLKIINQRTNGVLYRVIELMEG